MNSAVAIRGRRPAGLPVAVVAAAAAVVATGVAVHHVSGRLGTATPPFVSVFGPTADLPWALAAAAVLAAVVAGAPVLAAPGRPGRFAGALVVAGLAVALTVNAARHGPAAWAAIFDLGPGGSFEAGNEYLPALPATVYGAHFLLDRFADLLPALPANAAAHPPGLLLLIHWAGLGTAERLAALCIAAAVALAPLTWALGRAVLRDESAARRAALLVLLCPDAVLFATTSADAVYAAVATGAAALLAARRPGLRVAGAAVLALATLLSWALLAVGAWAAVLAWRRNGLRAALRLAAGCGIAVVAFDTALAVGWGYDPIGTLRATSALYGHSLASVRPYWFWVAGSPVAWLVMLGAPVAGAWLHGVARRRPAALALAAVVLTAAVLGFSKAETERIWLFLAPLACVAAAEVLPARALRPALALLAVHALGWDLLFDTIW